MSIRNTHHRALRSLSAVLLGLGFMAAAFKNSGGPSGPEGLYRYTVKTIDGTDRSLSYYRGKVLLIVNVASECGYTPQYKGLQETYQKYKDRGFVILGFPSNDFGQQEPGSDNEIKTFCENTYHVTFDMFSKIDVKGPNQDPLYTYLTRDSESAHEIAWNFNKFLVDRSGRVVGYFPSKVTPTDTVLTQKIESLLTEPAK